MTGLVKGKVVIITGCSSGIGKDTARLFAEEGAKIAICARNYEKLLQTKELCEQVGAEAGAEVLALRADVTLPEDLEMLVSKTVERFGRIDALVNNAVTASAGKPFLETDESVIWESFNSGFLAAWRLMKLCFPYLQESKGSIVNFGSASGIIGVPGYAAYGGVKEAIRGMSRVVAKEWGKYGINVNCVCPTAITDNTMAAVNNMPEGKRDIKYLGLRPGPAGYVGNAYDDIAPTVVFLCSDWARYYTGQAFRADGGGTITAL